MGQLRKELSMGFFLPARCLFILLLTMAVITYSLYNHLCRHSSAAPWSSTCAQTEGARERLVDATGATVRRPGSGEWARLRHSFPAFS